MGNVQQPPEGGAVNFAPTEPGVTFESTVENGCLVTTITPAVSDLTIPILVTEEKSTVKSVNKDAPLQPALTSIDFSLWVTVDLSNQVLEDLKPEVVQELKNAVFPVRGGSDELSINLYDPFTSGRAKGAPDSPVGVFRNALSGLLAVGAQVNNRSITYVGDEKKILQVVSALAGRMTQDLTRALEVNPKSTPLPDTLASFGTLASFVNLSSWVSTATDSEAIGEVSVYSNLTVAAPAIADSKDPQKRIQRLMSTLVRASHEVDDATNIYLAVAFDSVSLFENARLHDLAVFLVDSLGFNALSRRAVADNAQDWLPADKLDALFPATSDILFFADLSSPVEADSEAEEDPQDA